MQKKKYHTLVNNVGLLQTMIVYPKIYQVSFVKVQISKINRSSLKLLCVSGIRNFIIS